jgi:hypothetical protein
MSQTTPITMSPPAPVPPDPPAPAISPRNIFSAEGFGATLSGAGILAAMIAIEGVIQANQNAPHTVLEWLALIAGCVLAGVKALTK